MYLKENIEFLKTKYNVSSRTISKKTGISTKTLSYIKNDKSSRVSLNTVILLANYFEITIDELVNENFLFCDAIKKSTDMPT